LDEDSSVWVKLLAKIRRKICSIYEPPAELFSEAVIITIAGHPEKFWATHAAFLKAMKALSQADDGIVN